MVGPVRAARSRPLGLVVIILQSGLLPPAAPRDAPGVGHTWHREGERPVKRTRMQTRAASRASRMLKNVLYLVASQDASGCV
jgi:hypothetical protein